MSRASAPGTGPAAAQPVRARQAYLLRAGVAALASAALALWLVTYDEEARNPRVTTRDVPTHSAADEAEGPNVPVPTGDGPRTEAPSAAVQGAESGAAATGQTAEPAASPAADAAPTAPDDPAPSAPSSEQQAVAPASSDAAPAAADATPLDAASSAPQSDAPARPGAAAGPAGKDDTGTDEAASSARAAPASPPLARGYMVQLGVFSEPGNAHRLRDELAAQGYPAHVQSRVVLGPFPDRQAAANAQERVRKARRIDGVVVPPRKR